jgi:hypothetical protein
MVTPSLWAWQEQAEQLDVDHPVDEGGAVERLAAGDRAEDDLLEAAEDVLGDQARVSGADDAHGLRSANIGLDRAEEQLVDAGDDGVDVAILAAPLADDEADGGLVGEDGVEHGGEALLVEGDHHLDRRVGGARDVGDARAARDHGADARGDVLHQGEEDAALVVEVLVERAAADARGGADVGDVGGVVGAAGEDVLGDGEDLLAARRGAEVGARAAPAPAAGAGQN